MKEQHTPGPWRLDYVIDGGFQIFGTAEGDEVVITTRQPAPQRFAEFEANAMLITAAPELLAALRVMVGMYTALANSGDCGFWNPETEAQVIEARAAIAKAEGV